MGTDSTHSRALPPGVDTVIVTAFGLPAQGGIQRSVDQVATGLGRRCLVISPPMDGDEAFDQTRPYHVWRQLLFSGRYRPSWWWLVGWVKAQRHHGLKTVIFGHYSAAAVAGVWLQATGLQYVVLVHGRDLLMEQRRWPALAGFVLRRAAWIGVNSKYVGHLVRAHGVTEAKIVRTHPAVPDAMIQARTKPASHALVTIGRLVARKNIANVIRALPLIQKTVPDVLYHVIGDGPERGRLEFLRHELGLDRVVVFHGQVNDDARDALLDQAGCFVMVPTISEQGTDVEGLGLVYIEAAARGVPIVASPTGGVPDIVQPGVTGELVDGSNYGAMAEVISRVLRQPSRYSATAQKVVSQEFTWSVRNQRVRAMLNPVQVEIGVVIPAYNSAGRIGQTLTDVFAQTLPPREVVVVDDGSTDDLETVLKPWHSRIQLIHQTNQGAAAARNAGAAKITSPYIIFVDADIRLRPDAFSLMVRALVTHPEAAYAYSSFRFGPKDFNLFDFDPDRLRQTNYIHTTSLIRRDQLVPFDTRLTKFQDWDLWLSLLAKGRGGLWVPERLFSVSQAGGRMSTWLPSFVYRLPLIGQGRGSAAIARYRAAEAIIRTKHRL